MACILYKFKNAVKERLLKFIKKLLRIHSPNCMGCQYGDFGYNSGPCRGCDIDSKFIHYKEEK